MFKLDRITECYLPCKLGELHQYFSNALDGKVVKLQLGLYFSIGVSLLMSKTN